MGEARESELTKIEPSNSVSVSTQIGDKLETKTTNQATAKKVTNKKAPASAKRVRARAPRSKVALVPEIKADKPVDVTNPDFYLNREINWIDFDKKVLEQASDTSVPLLERVKFLSIFFNNLDEFFMVRVANVWKQVQSGAEATGADKLPPRRQLSEIGRRVRNLTEQAEVLWKKNILPALEKQSIRIVDYADLPAKKREILSNYFDNEIFPILTPQAIDSGHPFPLVSNTSINFIIELVSEKNKSDIRYARLKCPNNVPRFLYLPKGKEDVDPKLAYDDNYDEVNVVLVEDLIEECMERLFPGYKVNACGQFRITRNTDGEIEEDEADDLLAAVRDYVDQRRFGDIVRLEMGRGMPVRLADLLIEHLEVKPHQIYSNIWK